MIVLVCQTFSEKTKDKFFPKMQKTTFWTHFANFWEKHNFPQNSVLTSSFLFWQSINQCPKFQNLSVFQTYPRTGQHEFIRPFFIHFILIQLYSSSNLYTCIHVIYGKQITYSLNLIYEFLFVYNFFMNTNKQL